MNKYRATTPAAVAVYGEGELELDLSASDEANAIASGLLELVPREYRVLTNNYAVPQNEIFEDTYLVEVETALIEGGHIERVKTPVTKSPKPPKPVKE